MSLIGSHDIDLGRLQRLMRANGVTQARINIKDRKDFRVITLTHGDKVAQRTIGYLAGRGEVAKELREMIKEIAPRVRYRG